MAAFCGSARTSASTIEAMVEAVPMVMQCPAERAIQLSTSMKSRWFIAPILSCSLKRHRSVPEPMSLPWYLPFSIGPPETTRAGTSQLAAPMTRAGVVLSQPHKSTTPSTGFARIDSSTSMLTRLRNNIAVGRMLGSPVEVTGNSTGKPPFSQTPRLTRSAISRRCALQGVSSDHVLQIPMIGRPSKTWSGKPWFRIWDRWTNPSLSSFPNQAADRYSNFLSVISFVTPRLQRMNCST